MVPPSGMSPIPSALPLLPQVGQRRGWGTGPAPWFSTSTRKHPVWNWCLQGSSAQLKTGVKMVFLSCGDQPWRSGIMATWARQQIIADMARCCLSLARLEVRHLLWFSKWPCKLFLAASSSARGGEEGSWGWYRSFPIRRGREPILGDARRDEPAVRSVRLVWSRG